MVFDDKFMSPLFDILDKCDGVKQEKKYHPEEDLLNHSLQTMGWAFRETNDTDLILAALLHDVGKTIIRRGHEKESVILLEDLVSAKTLFLIKHHMRIWAYLKGEMKKLSKVQFLASHPWLPELVQLARFDELGRNPNRRPKYDKESIVKKLNEVGMSRFESKQL